MSSPLALLEWTDAAGVEMALEIDATPSQTFESTAEVTEHPVESGAAVADHIRPTGGTFSLEGVISNSPIVLPSTQMDGITRAPATIVLPGGEKATVEKWSRAPDRVRACDELFQSIVEGRVPVKVTTALRVLENMALVRYGVAKTADTGDALPVTLEFKKLRIVSTRRVAVPAVRRLQVQAPRGSQPVDDRSVLARGLDGGAPVTAAQDRAARQRQGIR